MFKCLSVCMQATFTNMASPLHSIPHRYFPQKAKNVMFTRARLSMEDGVLKNRTTPYRSMARAIATRIPQTITNSIKCTLKIIISKFLCPRCSSNRCKVVVLLESELFMLSIYLVCHVGSNIVGAAFSTDGSLVTQKFLFVVLL